MTIKRYKVTHQTHNGHGLLVECQSGDWVRWEDVKHAIDKTLPIDMVLFCPSCGKQHIDEPQECPDSPGICECKGPHWRNPPHRSHECQHCKFTWRPADVATNGVAAVKTKGQRDNATCDPERPGCGVTTHCNGACHGVTPDGSPK